MRINKFLALATGMSRRSADAAIAAKRVLVNGNPPRLDHQVNDEDAVTLDGQRLTFKQGFTTLILNKPTGFVCSRDGQGSQTVYDLLPRQYHVLKPVGRLDKDSSGVLLMTNDGNLANDLTHPSFQKKKIYDIRLDKPLSATDKRQIEQGVQLEDGLSQLSLQGKGRAWEVIMSEGRNRQIRRTFANLGYTVTQLHRTAFGPYKTQDLRLAEFKVL